jgi:hypothetical protein
MSFFYDLNKKLDSIRATPEVTHQQLNERDMSRAAKGYEKYGREGMEALAKAGREGKALDPVRKKYDKYDTEEVNEGGYVVNGIYKDLEIEPKRPEELENKMTRGTRPADKQLQNYKMPDKSRPADKQLQNYKMPDKSRPAKDVDESGGPAPAKPKSMVDKQVSKMKTPPPTRPNPAPKGEFMGTIKGGVWTADPPKPGEKGVPLPKNHERVPEAGAPMTPKQKSFAKLAPPADKITFADKIAGAKKEVDEMLGDVAAEAMRSALGGGKGRNAEMDEERSKGTAFDMSTPRAAKPKVGSIERGAKHDIKHTATGRMVTRRTDDQGNSVGADDDNEASGEKRGRGRPKGTKQSIGAKGPSGKSKLMTKEGEDDPAEKGEYDREGDMALDDIDTIESAANELQSIIDAEDNLPEWVQSKINKAMDYLDTARDYMAAQGNDQEPIAEKAVSKQQQKFMGMARAMQKGEKVKGASKELKKVASTMKPKDTEDFAKTKHKGLPEKKKKEVDETSEEGRITTTRTGPGKTLTTSSTGRVSATIGNGKMSVKPGKQDKPMDDDTDTASSSTKDTSKPNSMVGKGIYDSMNRELELMIAESMSINMSDSTEGNKSLTVTATDEDAMKLGMLLKNAGLGGGDMHSHGEQPCATCGMPDCGCGDVQEAVDDNAPDYPTNTEQADNNFGYSGGLNKPKADIAGNGQSTVPVVATRPHNDDDLQRIREMAGLAEAARPDYIDLDGDGNEKESMKDAADDKEEDSVEESIQRMREMAGIQEAKKEVDEEKTDEGNKFAFNVLKAKAAGKKEADLDGDGDMEKVRESIFALNNQWKAYKG